MWTLFLLDATPVPDMFPLSFVFVAICASFQSSSMLSFVVAEKPKQYDEYPYYDDVYFADEPDTKDSAHIVAVHDLFDILRGNRAWRRGLTDGDGEETDHATSASDRPRRDERRE